MRATEISKLLGPQIEGVVRLLLPNGKREGQEWRVGSVDGEAGKSMGVHLSGEKAGVWLDGASGQTGDAIGLWMAVRGLEIHAACKEAMDYLGIREDKIDPPTKRYSKPTRDGISKLSIEHADWFINERKISRETLNAYKVATRDGAIMFPYMDGDELVAAKYRKLPKTFRQDADCAPSLFGWQAIEPDARSVIICEGELDAMAWHTYGFPALSVPMGGGKGAKQGWIATEYDRLSVYDVIYVSMDSDGPGQDAEKEIADRLGRERCRVLRLPRKDANACLMDGMGTGDMAAALRDARTLDPSELRCAADFEDAVWAEFTRKDMGLALPWKKTHDTLLLRPGETSIWAGVNGHGKSAVVSHVVGDMATHGVRCCVASMEYRTPMWLMKMARQISGTGNPSESFIRAIVKDLKNWLWAFDVSGSAKASRILEVFRYARRRYDIELFVIDNLTKCGFADDDYSGQKKFIEEITDFARIEHVHVAVVAHMRKSDSEDQPSGKMGVKGSGGIIDMADTLIEVWRNKPKEKKIKQHEKDDIALPDEIKNEADTLLFVRKQRATGLEPTIGLWFDPGTTQFLSHHSHTPRPMTQPILNVVTGIQA